MSRLSQCIVTEEWKEEEDDDEEEEVKAHQGNNESGDSNFNGGVSDGDGDEYVIKSGNPEALNKSVRYPLFRAALQKSALSHEATHTHHMTRERNNSTGTVLVKNAIQEPDISSLIDW